MERDVRRGRVLERIWLPILLLAMVAATALGPNAYAQGGGYEVIEVTDGGAVKGRVVFKGEPPARGELTVNKNEDFCGQTVPDESLVVSGDGGVKNAVVYIDGITKGKAPSKEPAVIDNMKCAFVPHVVIGVLGGELQVKNSDPILHNTHLYTDSRTLVNLALPLQDQTISRPIRKSGLLTGKCDAHSWMSTYIMVLEHPYAAATDESGSFEIGDIPPGTYKLKMWHEELGEQEKELKVEPGGAAEAVFETSK